MSPSSSMQKQEKTSPDQSLMADKDKKFHSIAPWPQHPKPIHSQNKIGTPPQLKTPELVSTLIPAPPQINYKMDQGEAEEIPSITDIDDDMKVAKEDPMGTNNTANNLTGADDSVIQSSQESDHIPSAQVDITDDMEEDDKVGYKRTQTEMKEMAEGAPTQSAPLSTA